MTDGHAILASLAATRARVAQTGLILSRNRIRLDSLDAQRRALTSSATGRAVNVSSEAARSRGSP